MGIEELKRIWILLKQKLSIPGVISFAIYAKVVILIVVKEITSGTWCFLVTWY